MHRNLIHPNLLFQFLPLKELFAAYHSVCAHDVCVCMSMCATAHVWGSEDKSMKLVIPLTFIPVQGFQNWTKVPGLVCKPLYPWNKLIAHPETLKI